MRKFAVIVLCVVAGLLSFATVPAQEAPKEIKGGILNGKAVSLPSPEYPPEAKAAGWEGTVVVDVVIDESGNVSSAVASSVVRTPWNSDLDQTTVSSFESVIGDATVKAALEAKFAPTRLNGVPVKVSGSIVYNFSVNAIVPAVSSGVLNGRATSLPKPEYPEAAKAVRAGGTVVVRVVVDESGDVISAAAISGHPLLRAASVEAAKAAKFPATMIDTPKPVKVSGMVVYNFVPPTKKETN
jgi:TonB family protein